jgi:dynein heavy chain
MVKLESQNEGAKEYQYEGKKVYANDPKDFTETFKNFCFASLYIKEEVIKAL